MQTIPIDLCIYSCLILVAGESLTVVLSHGIGVLRLWRRVSRPSAVLGGFAVVNVLVSVFGCHLGSLRSC